MDDLGPKRVVANLHYLPDQLEAHLTPKGVSVVPRRTRDSGNRRRVARRFAFAGDSDPVFTLNTDAIWSGPNPLTLLRDAWDPDRMDALLMCVPR